MVGKQTRHLIFEKLKNNCLRLHCSQLQPFPYYYSPDKAGMLHIQSSPACEVWRVLPTTDVEICTMGHEVPDQQVFNIGGVLQLPNFAHGAAGGVHSVAGGVPCAIHQVFPDGSLLCFGLGLVDSGTRVRRHGWRPGGGQGWRSSQGCLIALVDACMPQKSILPVTSAVVLSYSCGSVNICRPIWKPRVRFGYSLHYCTIT